MIKLLNIPPVNLQALIALFLFLLSLIISNIVMKIKRGELLGGSMMVMYLRFILGFCFAGSIYLAFYSFAGVNVLF